MATNKIKIFLGDLVHTWKKNGTWTIPLNIGYVPYYKLKSLKRDGISCSFKLYKAPTEMIADIKKEKPDVVGLAHYVWNMNLNRRIFDITKKYSPGALTIGGGHILQIIMLIKMVQKNFFRRIKIVMHT